MDNYDKIMAQMPEEPMGEEAKVNPNSLEPNVNQEIGVEEEEQPSTSAWVAKGNKRQKTKHVPERVVSRTLQAIPSNDQYFVDIRKNNLQERVIEVGKSSNDLQFEACKLDDRVI